METQELELLELMLELTRQQKIKWEKTDDNFWEAQVQGEKFHVEFIYFARTDEVGSDRTMARLGAFNLCDYCIGTQGFELICEMLSIGDNEWTKSRAMGEQRIKDGLKFLQQLRAG